MFVFGHLGIGLKLAQPFSRGLSRRAIILGALLPDLVDKPVFYAVRALTGASSPEALRELVISGTRTFGHTAIFTFALALTGVARRDTWLAAVALGMGTHHLLDSVLTPTPNALLWPLMGWQFPLYPFEGPMQHFSAFFSGPLFWAEMLGFILWVDELWFKPRRRRRSF